MAKVGTAKVHASTPSRRPLFLAGLAALYYCAFASYYLQFPGLFGVDGVQPSAPYLDRMRKHAGVAEKDAASWSGAAAAMKTFPSLLWLAEPLDVSLDAWTEGLALLGVALSIAAMLGAHHAIVFAALYLLYHSLYLSGQSMLSFQWDIFLLETGFAAILYAPLWGSARNAPLPPVMWLLRFQVFKIMFMSGIVKTQADCPTWKGLTALEFHFASQCIPTAEAWWAHQMPPLLLRIGVAATFITQVPGPFLLLAPSRWCRRLGVVLQAPLQLLIMLTGNYNWFNLHVLVLCIPCWEADSYPALLDHCHGLPFLRGFRLLRVLRMFDKLWQLLWCGAGIVMLARSMPFLIQVDGLDGGTLFAELQHMMVRLMNFDVGSDLWDWTAPARITNVFGVQQSQVLLENTMPSLINYLAVVAVGTGMLFCLSQVGGRIIALLAKPGLAKLVALPIATCYALSVSVGAAGLLGIAVLPLGSMYRPTGKLMKELPHGLGDRVEQMQKALEPLTIASGYGLFRRMTGVNEDTWQQGHSWGQMPPSMVAVPVVVLEGTRDGHTWEELPFRYVQGDPHIAPRRTAPLQPRLDWRMWFAALGSFQHDPWIIHLAVKLMLGSEDVIALMDVDRYPFSKERPPRSVRAIKYHFDFTRKDTPWARRIPGVQLVDHNRTLLEALSGKQLRKQAKVYGVSDLVDSSLSESEQRQRTIELLLESPAPWWHRTRRGDYFPALRADDESLKEFLGKFGWRQELLAPRRKHPCSYSASGPRKATKRGTSSSEGVQAAEGAARAAAAGFCRLVLTAHTLARPVRVAVGWTTSAQAFLDMIGCPADSLRWLRLPLEAKFFFDAHLLAAATAVGVPLLLKVILSCLLCRQRQRGQLTKSGKQKEE